MVQAEDCDPFAHNPTGFVPQFRGVPVSEYEIGFTPGKKAASVRAFDNVETGKGYSGRPYHPLRQLPFVLDRQPGALEGGPPRRKRP